MPTIIKTKNHERTYVCHPIDEIVTYIKLGKHACLRETPCIRFAADYLKVKGQPVVREYCGLVSLCITHLPGEAEVNHLMQRVIILPHTHLAWRSDDRRSLYIVCRLTWNEDTPPTTPDEMRQYHENGYKLLHYLYSSQLVLNLDTLSPTLDAEVPYAYDPEVYYNPQSIAFHVSNEQLNLPRPNIPESQKGVKLLEGMDEEQTLAYLFHTCHRRAIIDARARATDELSWQQTTCTLLARYCHQWGVPMGYAASHAKLALGDIPPHVIDLAIENAYAKESMKGYPYGIIGKNTLLTLQTDSFLKANYHLRRNTLTGEVQYRERTGYDFSFRPLTEQVLNSITIRALKIGIGAWDKDVRRLINSNDIEQYNPLAEYLMALPKWDGKDHVGAFTDRIPCAYPHKSHHLHVWLLSMVAHWLGKDTLHGNAIVPMLIGHQGCGKTTLASMVLPPELRTYYNDKVDFRSDSDLLTGLSNYALINIDEFDALKKSQQPVLKYLLSKSEVKFRPAYGKTIEHRRRYASFIATTNLTRPLVDRTGSRRFICLHITPGMSIDTHSPINYDQLYAQLVAEINAGQPYWFTDAENTELQQHNAKYVRINNLSEMIDSLFHLPTEDEIKAVDESNTQNGGTPNAQNLDKLHTLDEIIAILSAAFPNITITNTTHRDIGRLLTEKGYPVKKTKHCNKYMICRN